MLTGVQHTDRKTWKDEVNVWHLHVDGVLMSPAITRILRWTRALCPRPTWCTWRVYHKLKVILLTYSLTPWSRVLLEKLTGSKLINKFPTIYGTWMFITVFTSVRHLSLSWASSIQSMSPHPTCWRPILIFSSHLCLGFLSDLFLSGFGTETLHTPHFSSIRAACPDHLSLLDLLTRTVVGEEYRSFSSSLGGADGNTEYKAFRY